MLEVNKLNLHERTELELLLKSDKLCFNDINEDGIHLFNVALKGEIIGYFGYQLFDGVALFRSMVVKPQVRKKGYGVLIWHQAKIKLQSEGAHEAYLLTNTAAPFFLKQGFEEVPRSSAPENIASTTEFKEFCPDDSICMRINLT